MKKRVPFLWFFFILMPILSFADNVYLNNGQVITGHIKKEESEQVIIESRGTAFPIPRSKIIKIEKVTDEENIFRQGDELFARREYDKAIEAYKGVIKINPEKANLKIQEARQAWLEDMEKSLAGKSIEYAEKILRQELKDLGNDENSLPVIKKTLTRILMKKAQKTTNEVDVKGNLTCLQEAYDLSSDDPEVALTYIHALQRYYTDSHNEKMVQVLKSFVNKHPENIEAVELLATQVWKKNPWEALALLYPNNAPHPQATKNMKALLPEVLLACFNTKPYPKDAPFDKCSCYERLMAIKPDVSPLPLLQFKVSLNPHSPADLFNLGNYYLQQQQYEKAVEFLSKSASIENREEVIKSLSVAKEIFEKESLEKAKIFLENKNPYESQLVCERFLQLIPENKNILQMLQKVCYIDRCSNCNGVGQNQCSKCIGSGKVYINQQAEEDIVAYQLIEGKNSIITDPRTGKTTNFKTYKCKYCGFEYGVNMNYPLKKCPMCGKGGKTIVQKKVMVQCDNCSGTGYKGVCSSCKGTGLITLEKPRKSIILLSQKQNSDVKPSLALDEKTNELIRKVILDIEKQFANSPFGGCKILEYQGQVESIKYSAKDIKMDKNVHVISCTILTPVNYEYKRK
ncbi:MAG: hypothetical protein NT106_13465 [Candidatus Sumerlaeota bacterium]|nr:hypothetical protein [Candidatus Sumerlaeota bacterium]